MTEALRRPLSVRTEIVTPSIARQWLDRLHENQRKRKPSVIERYARDMRAGKWHDTGEAIKFDSKGDLVDGQQRLNAVVVSGVTVSFLVVDGLDSEAMIVMDSGTPRTFADSLKITHTMRTSQVGSVVRRVFGFSRGNYTGQMSSVYVNPTRSELMDFYKQFMGEFDTAAQRGKDVANQKLGNGTSAGTAFFLFARLDEDGAHSFFERVLSGVNLGFGDPALTLSRRLAQRQWATAEQLAGWIRGWNAYREDKSLERILLSKSGPLTNQNFPLPK